SVPSRRKLFARPRLPFALNKPNEPGESVAPDGSPVAPGTVTRNLVKSRPLIGKSSAALVVIVPPSVLVVVSTCTFVATKTVVSGAATLNVTSTRRSLATSTVTLETSAAVKPGCSTRTSYGPTGSSATV